MKNEKIDLLLERLIIKLTSSRTLMAVGMTALLTFLLVNNNINENNYIDAFKWIWTAFFGTKAVEKVQIKQKVQG